MDEGFRTAAHVIVNQQLTLIVKARLRYCSPASLARMSASKSCWKKSSEVLTSMAVESARESDQVSISKLSTSISQTATPSVSPVMPAVPHSISPYQFDVPFTDFA